MSEMRASHHNSQHNYLCRYKIHTGTGISHPSHSSLLRIRNTIIYFFLHWIGIRQFQEDQFFNKVYTVLMALPANESSTRKSSRLRMGSSLISLFVLLGLFIVVSMWQSRELIQAFKDIPLVFEGVTLPTTGNWNLPTSAPSAEDTSASSLVADDDDEEKEWDLVFWSSIPILEEGVDPSSFIISRKFSKDVNANLWEMDEVIRVDFRLCEDDDGGNCSSILSHAINNNTTRWMRNMSKGEVELLPQYQRNKDRVLQVFAPKIGLNNTQNKINLGHLEAITFWSDRHQQYIPVDYPMTSIEVRSCQPQTSCPESCPENRQNPDWMYPYLYDTQDGICKSSHPDDVPPKRLVGGVCNCESTCFTAEATALNSTWPWKDAAERDLFLPHWNNEVQTRHTAMFYSKMMRRRKTEEEYGTSKARFTCPNQTVTPSPIFGDFQHHLFYIPEAKLIFCGIPKVGVTEWIKFFRNVIGAKDYLSLPHYKVDRTAFFMSSLEPSKAEELLNDPTWTKAVFFRNPFERLLSSYMNKIVGESYTQTTFKIGNSTAPKEERPVLTFAEFVDRVTDNTVNSTDCNNPNGLRACTDPHWKPQVMTCGMDQLLPKFDFIASFDHISEHTRILLERVGLWEKYGATFDDGKDADGNPFICVVPQPKRRLNETVWGFNQKGPSGAGNNTHATGSRSRFSDYYTPELLKKVREAYALDFAVWDEISSKDRPVDEIATGKDLKVVREYCAGR